jgi:hypothetical protein
MIVTVLVCIFFIAPTCAERLRLRGLSHPYTRYTSADHYSGLGRDKSFDKSICQFTGGLSDSPNIFKIGHSLAVRRRYADSKDCFANAISSWWKAVRTSNPIILRSQTMEGRFGNSAAMRSLHKSLASINVGEKEIGEDDDENKRPQVPPQLQWMKTQEAINPKMASQVKEMYKEE